MSENVIKFRRYSIVSLIFSVILVIITFALQKWIGLHTANLMFLASLNTFFFSLLIFNEYRLLYKADLEKEDQEAREKATQSCQWKMKRSCCIILLKLLVQKQVEFLTLMNPCTTMSTVSTH